MARPLAVMAVFALSCFGLLLVLWLQFGGSIPLAPKSYRFQVAFPQALQLSKQAEVRISGVAVGRVSGTRLDSEGRTVATLELDAGVPVPSTDARAILRQKTLLGETYVELTPGTPEAPRLREGGTLTRGRAATSVQLDEVLRTFDGRTQAAFRAWTQGLAEGVEGRGSDLSDALGNLAPLTGDADELLALLVSQEGGVRRLVRNTGIVAGALAERRGQLRSLVSNADVVFASIARRAAPLRRALAALPTFEREARITLRRLEEFAHTANPVVSDLRPAARAAGPVLGELARAAPELRRLLVTLRPLTTASRAGIPALTRVLDGARPLLGAVPPFVRQLVPITDVIAHYRRELMSFIVNTTAATQAYTLEGATKLHYFRGVLVLRPEALAVFPRRIAGNRANPYPPPGQFRRLPIPVYDVGGCAGPQPTLGPGPVPAEIRRLIHELILPDAGPAAPPCTPQRRAGPAFPHVTAGVGDRP